jgi:hypothetical protein
MKRHELINKLIQDNGFKTYLEIGLGDGRNFAKIKCEQKAGVDPNAAGVGIMQEFSVAVISEESDYFFKYAADHKFDIIFIDGLHTAEQVERDIVNSWNCLNKGGIILLHDINPPTKESQMVPKVSSPWKGDVWRAFGGFMAKYVKVQAYTTLDDTGIGWIHKSRHKVELGFIDSETTYEKFDSMRDYYLNIRR